MGCRCPAQVLFRSATCWLVPGAPRPPIDGAVMSNPHRPVRLADAALVAVAVLMGLTLSIGVMG